MPTPASPPARHDHGDLVKQREVALDEQWIEFRHVTLLIFETRCQHSHPSDKHMACDLCLLFLPEGPITESPRATHPPSPARKGARAMIVHPLSTWAIVAGAYF